MGKKVTVSGELRKAARGVFDEMIHQAFGIRPRKKQRQRPIYVIPAFDNSFKPIKGRRK